MKHIGIVACSVEGAALCYRSIAQIAEHYIGDYNHPKVTLHSIPMADWMPALNSGNYQAVAEFMLESANVLARAGADFTICPDNTVHLSWEHFIQRSPIPWLHIGEVVADEAQRHGWKKAGLLGTRFTMTGSMYRDVFRRYGMGTVAPSENDRQMIDEVIWSELVRGKFLEASRLRYNEVIQRLKGQACDCVILGCTEIPLLVHVDDCPLPVLDSTRLLAHAAVRYAIEEHERSVSA